MSRAGFCNQCNAYVWLAPDGSCPSGHPPSSIVLDYDPGSAEAGAITQLSAQQSLVLPLVVVASVALLFLLLVTSAALTVATIQFRDAVRSTGVTASSTDQPLGGQRGETEAPGPPAKTSVPGGPVSTPLDIPEGPHRKLPTAAGVVTGIRLDAAEVPASIKADVASRLRTDYPGWRIGPTTWWTYEASGQPFNSDYATLVTEARMTISDPRNTLPPFQVGYVSDSEGFAWASTDQVFRADGVAHEGLEPFTELIKAQYLKKGRTVEYIGTSYGSPTVVYRWGKGSARQVGADSWDWDEEQRRWVPAALF